MKKNSISKLVAVALCGLAILSSTTIRAQTSGADDVEAVPLTPAELTEHAAYLGANAKSTALIPTKISATKTSPQFVKITGNVTVKARLMQLDKSDRRNPVWRSLRSRNIEFEALSILRAAGRTQQNGWAEGVIKVPELKLNPNTLPRTLTWWARFRGDSRFKASSPDKSGRFTVVP